MKKTLKFGLKWTLKKRTITNGVWFYIYNNILIYFFYSLLIYHSITFKSSYYIIKIIKN